MHEPLLAQAALPAPVVCAGMLLRDYSIGHELILSRNSSPFLTEYSKGVKIGADHVFAASLVCSQTWEENRSMHKDPFLDLKIGLWRWRVKRETKRPEWLPLEIATFTEYRSSGSLEFPVSESVKPGRGESPRPPGAPFLFRIQQWLMLRLGISESAAWDYPLGLAIMRWETFWEGEGGMDLYNSQDAKFDRYVAEQEALVAQEKETPCRR